MSSSNKEHRFTDEHGFLNPCHPCKTPHRRSIDKPCRKNASDVDCHPS